LNVSNGGDLLRMLMPAVSPVPTSNAPRPDAKLPIESRNFDSLLAEARQASPQAETQGVGETQKAEATKPDTPADALPGLIGIGSIHNASLRQIVAGDTQA
jgi:hypothetical protein